MELWTRAAELARRLRYFLFRDRYTAELEEEIRLHVDLRAESLERQGLSPASARYAARRRFGNAVTIQERSRDMWGLGLAAQALSDCRFAVRRLRRRPAFALSVIVVAALGIGATTAVFSAFDAVLLRPLPFARPEELYTLPDVNLPFEDEIGQATSFLRIGDVAGMTDLFSHTAAYAAGGLNLVDPDNPQRLRVGVVTPDFFATLGARPQAGRTFMDAEGRPHGPRAVILSDAFWAAHFGRANVLGRSIDLSGSRYTVIGVMERGFSFPNESDLWIPLTVPTTMETFAPFRGWLPSAVIARAAPGVTHAVASARLMTAWQRVMHEGDIMTELRTRGTAIPLRETLVGSSERALVVLMAATLLLLLIAGANIANLLLSDAAGRQREVAVREVLGASRTRITRQLLVESLVLAGAGAAAGVAASPLLIRLIQPLLPPNLAGVSAATLDVRILGFAVLLTLAVGVVFGLWPALGSSRTDANETIKSGGLGSTTSRLGVARRVLIGAEVALTVALLVASGLMLRSLDRLMSQNMGLHAEQVGTLELSFARGTPRPERLRRLHGIIQQLESDPSIRSAAVVNDLPLRGGGGIGLLIHVDGRPKPSAPEELSNSFARFLEASGGYFRTLGIPLLRGRTFRASDDSLAPQVAVINDVMARHWWPNADALGKTFKFGNDTVATTVIGIVGTVREGRLDAEAGAQAYFSVDRQTPVNVAIVARSALPPATLLARMRAAVQTVDPGQAVYNLRMMDEVVSRSVAPRRVNTTLLALFAAVALLLSAFGVYAVVSYSVSRRGRELGIRAALGATGRDITLLVSGEMGRIVIVGLSLGLLAAWMLSRVLGALLFEVDAHDVWTFMAVPVVLLVPAAVATWIPARRAARVSPTEVMRAE